jgi:hypothetical protein
VLFGVLALVLTLAVAGALYQAIAAEIAERRYPPPGELVDAVGHRLHLNVIGQDEDGPIVFLEALRWRCSRWNLYAEKS